MQEGSAQEITDLFTNQNARAAFVKIVDEAWQCDHPEDAFDLHRLKRECQQAEASGDADAVAIARASLWATEEYLDSAEGVPESALPPAVRCWLKEIIAWVDQRGDAAAPPRFADAITKVGTKPTIRVKPVGSVDLGGILTQDAEEPEADTRSLAFPSAAFDNMPRLMRDVWKYTNETAINPQPVLALGAAIALFGAVFGRRVRDDYGTRTNVMVLCLAPSGSGKDHARNANKLILHHCGQDVLIGNERIGSHAGIISSMDAHPVRLFQLDEIGRLLTTMKDPRAAHLYNIGSVLMQLYSTSKSVFISDAYADQRKTKTIDQPCACVYGTSVPETFYDGLTLDNLSDGLLSRMLVIESSDYGEEHRKPADTPLPPQLINDLRAWFEFSTPRGNLNAVHPEPRLVEKTPEADARHEAYVRSIKQRHRYESAAHAAIWSRAPEKAAKLALIYALCDNWREPRVTLAAVDWARLLVNHTTRLVIQRATVLVGASRYEKDKKRVLALVTDGMTGTELNRKTPWLKPRDRKEILTDLEECGAIALERIPTQARPRMVIRRRK